MKLFGAASLKGKEDASFQYETIWIHKPVFNNDLPYVRKYFLLALQYMYSKNAILKPDPRIWPRFRRDIRIERSNSAVSLTKLQNQINNFQKLVF